jgi:hypothetical protein
MADFTVWEELFGEGYLKHIYEYRKFKEDTHKLTWDNGL